MFTFINIINRKVFDKTYKISIEFSILRLYSFILRLLQLGVNTHSMILILLATIVLSITNSL